MQVLIYRPPFKYYKQSPIGLVPKDGGRKTRLIFHLSHPRKWPDRSVNGQTPKDLCKVKYPSFDDAVRLCLKICHFCQAAKSDLTSAFRHLGIRKEDWHLLVMKAECPWNGRTYFFVDKCLPFGHALSCALFQKVSNAISYLTEFRTKIENINYLDDYFFAHINRVLCNHLVGIFTQVCNEIHFPVSEEKTVLACSQLTFLGLLIDTLRRMVSIPVDKVHNLRHLIDRMLKKKSNKVTLLEMQQICGHLNFVCQAVVPGRAFLRRLYYATQGVRKSYYHIKLTQDLKKDLLMWQDFLHHPAVYSRPFIDFESVLQATEVDLYTDASRNFSLGAGGSLSELLVCPGLGL